MVFLYLISGMKCLILHFVFKGNYWSANKINAPLTGRTLQRRARECVQTSLQLRSGQSRWCLQLAVLSAIDSGAGEATERSLRECQRQRSDSTAFDINAAVRRQSCRRRSSTSYERCTVQLGEIAPTKSLLRCRSARSDASEGGAVISDFYEVMKNEAFGGRAWAKYKEEPCLKYSIGIRL